MTLTDLRQLITARDEQHRQAAEALHKQHAEAFEAAHALRSELEGASDTAQQAQDLADILADVAKREHSSKAQRDRAALLVAQHTASAPGRLGASASAITDGAWQIRRLNMARWLTADERRAVTSAMIFAANGGELETGLLKFATPWHSPATLDALEELAEMLAPDELEKIREKYAALAAERDEVGALCRRLDAGAPSIYAVAEQLEEL